MKNDIFKFFWVIFKLSFTNYAVQSTVLSVIFFDFIFFLIFLQFFFNFLTREQFCYCLVGIQKQQ